MKIIQYGAAIEVVPAEGETTLVKPLTQETWEEVNLIKSNCHIYIWHHGVAYLHYYSTLPDYKTIVKTLKQVEKNGTKSGLYY